MEPICSVDNAETRMPGAPNARQTAFAKWRLPARSVPTMTATALDWKAGAFPRRAAASIASLLADLEDKIKETIRAKGKPESNAAYKRWQAARKALTRHIREHGAPERVTAHGMPYHLERSCRSRRSSDLRSDAQLARPMTPIAAILAAHRAPASTL